MAKAGRRSIFKGNTRGVRVQGWMTRDGGRAFERARRRLAELAERKPSAVSDSEVVEYLARGEADTQSYIAKALIRDL